MNYIKKGAIEALNELQKTIPSDIYFTIYEGLTEIEILRDRDKELEEFWEQTNMGGKTMKDFKEILRCRIENALDEGFANHIPLTSEFLADKLIGTSFKDEKRSIERNLAARIILERIKTDEDMVLGKHQSDFDKWVEEQDTAMRLAVLMLLDPVQYLTPKELRHAYELQQHEYDKYDIWNELELAAEDYIEKYGIDDMSVTDEEIERMAFNLRKMLDNDADGIWSYCCKESVTMILNSRNNEVDK